MDNIFYRTCSDRNPEFGTESFPKMVQLHDMLVVRLRNVIDFPDVPPQTSFLDLELLAPKWKFLISGCVPFLL